MGEFEVRGKDALNFIQYISTNDASKLIPYQAQYSSMCYPDGWRMVDDMIVYNLGDYYMLVVNGANIDKDWEWCNKNKAGFEVDLVNATDEYKFISNPGSEIA
jgi:aminomethyltransferase